jgi:hypothetical protein
MKLTSEIISTNLNLLEKSKKDFPLLVSYENCTDYSDKAKLRQEGLEFGLVLYLEFIDFIKEMTSKEQEIFYRRKIKNPEFQDILAKQANDEDARKSFKSKAAKSFEALMNSDKWEDFSGYRSNYRRKRRRWSNNFSGSEAIASNYIIQNELEIKDEYINRVCRWYRMKLPQVDFTVQNEINKTKDLISYMVEKMGDSGIDFRRLNFTHLTSQLSDEIRRKILTIDTDEKIKLIANDFVPEGFTPGNLYNVIAKQLSTEDAGGGNILMVNVRNDMDKSVWVKYRYFETVSNLRDSALDFLLNS